MNIYDIVAIERQLEAIAEANEGEIPEEKLMELVEAQTKSVEQIDKLCRYMRHMEMGADACTAEVIRIEAMRDKAKNRIASIKKYLTPFVAKRGKMTIGTFTLSVRKSESVELDDQFFNANFSRVVETVKPNRKMIKEALKEGLKIKGARLVDKQNLQLK